MTMIRDFHKTAIIAGERRVSYTELLRRITLFAQHTPHEAGARTVIFSKNREGWAYAFFSVWQNQGIAVPVDATSTVDEVAYVRFASVYRQFKDVQSFMEELQLLLDSQKKPQE